MAGKPVGTMFAEIGLDATRLEKGLEQTHKALVDGTIKVESAYKSLGIKSDQVYDQMRRNATAAVDFIKNKTLSSKEEIVRAEQAAAEKIKRINEQQYGAHVSLLDKMKQNWIATTAAVTAAYIAAQKMWGLVDQAAAYAENLETLNFLTSQYNVTGQQMVKIISENSDGLIDLATAAKVSADAIAKGFTPEQLAQMAKWAPVIDDFSSSVGSSKEAFELLVSTMAAGRERGTVQLLGATIDLKTAFGEQAENMSKAEKAMGIYNLVAQRMVEIQKTGVGTTNSLSDSIERYKNQIEELKLTLGDILIRMGAGLMATFQSVAAFALGLTRVIMAPIQALMLATDYLGITKGKAEEYKTAMEAMADAGEDLAQKAAANFELMKKGMQAGGTLAKGGGALGFGDAAGGGGAGKTDPAIERRLREVAKMYAEEGKLVHDALMAELGMNDEYKLTLKKMDDEAWAEEKKGIEAQAKFESDRLKEREDELRDSYLAETGMTQEYIDTVREMRDAEFEAWKKSIEEMNRLIHDAFGDMASAFTAIGNMYDKNSDEYARMQEAAKAMIVLQQAVAVANAVAVIANQGLGDPYTAFARIAAMAAAMGSLLASIGASVGGGGAASAPVLPASTVLGAEAGTGSESISKVWELLEDTYDLEYRELTGIHNSMKELNQNITGLVASVFRTGGVANFGEATGTTFMPARQFQEDFNKPLSDLLAGDPIGKWAFDFFSDLFGDALFGSEINAEWVSGGIRTGMQTFADIFKDGVVDAWNYSIVHVTGGENIFGGGGYNDMRGAVEDMGSETHKLLSLAFKNIGDSLLWLAGEFGVDTQKVRDYVIKAADINLKDMSGEEATKAIQEYFSNVADTATTAIFGDLISKYQKLDEAMFETAVRVATDIVVVMETLEKTGQAFSGTIPQIIAFSESLIAMAGGLDVLQEASATYYDKFFTDAEKQARLQGQLSGALGDMGMALPGSRSGYRALVEGIDLTTEAGKEAYVALLKWSQAADDYYSAMGDNLDMQNNLTASLKKQSEAIRDWLADLNMSALAPVVSMESYRAEYERQRSAAYAPGATEQDLSGFLNYAKEYLQFMRTYGGDYKAIYDAITGDVGQLGDIKDAQLAAIEAADAAAREAAAKQAALLALVVQATTERDVARLPAIRETADRIADPNTRYIPEYAIGGLTSGPSMAGETGREWVVPTYEPQRSNFLRSVPEAFWENLQGGGAVGGRPIEITLNNITTLDGKVLARSTVKYLKSDGTLAESVRRVN